MEKGRRMMPFFIVHFSELSERKREKQKTTCYAGGGEKASASSIPKQPPYIV